MSFRGHVKRLYGTLADGSQDASTWIDVLRFDETDFRFKGAKDGSTYSADNVYSWRDQYGENQNAVRITHPIAVFATESPPSNNPQPGDPDTVTLYVVDVLKQSNRATSDGATRTTSTHYQNDPTKPDTRNPIVVRVLENNLAGLDMTQGSVDWPTYLNALQSSNAKVFPAFPIDVQYPRNVFTAVSGIQTGQQHQVTDSAMTLNQGWANSLFPIATGSTLAIRTDPIQLIVNGHVGGHMSITAIQGLWSLPSGGDETAANNFLISDQGRILFSNSDFVGNSTAITDDGVAVFVSVTPPKWQVYGYATFYRAEGNIYVGKLLWTYTGSTANSDTTSAVVATGDDAALVLIIGDATSTLYKISSDGNVIWQQPFVWDNTDTGYWLVDIASGWDNTGPIATALAFSPSVFPSYADPTPHVPVLIGLDGSGSVQSTLRLSTPWYSYIVDETSSANETVTTTLTQTITNTFTLFSKPVFLPDGQTVCLLYSKHVEQDYTSYEYQATVTGPSTWYLVNVIGDFIYYDGSGGYFGSPLPPDQMPGFTPVTAVGEDPTTLPPPPEPATGWGLVETPTSSSKTLTQTQSQSQENGFVFVVSGSITNKVVLQSAPMTLLSSTTTVDTYPPFSETVTTSSGTLPALYQVIDWDGEDDVTVWVVMTDGSMRNYDPVTGTMLSSFSAASVSAPGQMPGTGQLSCCMQGLTIGIEVGGVAPYMLENYQTNGNIVYEKEISETGLGRFSKRVNTPQNYKPPAV